MVNGRVITVLSYDSYNTTDPDEILQVRLNGVTTFIGIVGLTVAFSVLIILLAR